jgi:trehalose-6-phosphate synthase
VSGAIYRKGWTIWIDPYKLFMRPIFFRMDPETAHNVTFWFLGWVPARIMLFLCKPRQILP